MQLNTHDVLFYGFDKEAEPDRILNCVSELMPELREGCEAGMNCPEKTLTLK